MKRGLVHESEFDNPESPWRWVRDKHSHARRIGEYYLFIECADDPEAFDFDILVDDVDKQTWLDERMANGDTVTGALDQWFPHQVSEDA